MDKDPLVSIIVPVYNVESYLEQCIESVRNQTYANIEIILVNNGSTDNSGTICDAYSRLDDRITVLHTINNGLSAARNIGLDLARGEWITFVDSDDWLDPCFIGHMLIKAVEYDVPLVICGFVNEYPGKTDSRRIVQETVFIEGENVLKAALVDCLISSVVWNKIYKREVWDSQRFVPERKYEDVEIMHKLLENVQRAVIIPEIYYHYRCRLSGLSKQNTMDAVGDFWKGCLERYDRHHEKGNEYRAVLTKGCINSAYRVIKVFDALPAKQKHDSAKDINEIRQFFIFRYAYIMTENRYLSGKDKIKATIIRYNNPLFALMVNLVTILQGKNSEELFE